MNKILIPKETLTKAKEFMASYKEKLKSNEELFESNIGKYHTFSIRHLIN